MIPLPRLMVAPNGARLGPKDHPKLPVTLPQIIDTARACFAAGADGLHLHLRDTEGKHILDTGLYREALAQLTATLPNMSVQITTESNGLYQPPHQRKIALSSGARLVSVSVREMASDTTDETLADFYAQCVAAGIAVQHILYDVSDFSLLRRVLPETLFHKPELQLIFVLGRYSESNEGSPSNLDPFLRYMQAHALKPDWAVCAFGAGETACLRYAHELGGKCRVGFENSMFREDGAIAQDNAQRVSDIAATIALRQIA